MFPERSSLYSSETSESNDLARSGYLNHYDNIQDAYPSQYHSNEEFKHDLYHYYNLRDTVFLKTFIPVSTRKLVDDKAAMNIIDERVNTKYSRFSINKIINKFKNDRITIFEASKIDWCTEKLEKELIRIGIQEIEYFKFITTLM